VIAFKKSTVSRAALVSQLTAIASRCVERTEYIIVQGRVPRCVHAQCRSIRYVQCKTKNNRLFSWYQGYLGRLLLPYY
jgi:hypothetical protein